MAVPAQTTGAPGLAAGVVLPSRDAPEIASGFRQQRLVRARDYMAVTANPHGTQAAVTVLERGGTAVDAAVAAQMVLNVVEPQSSGLGGGGFMLYYDAGRERLLAFDGRETAPMQAWEGYLREVSPDSGEPVQPSPRASGRSVGVPGLVAMLELAHDDYGTMPWSSLFIPAIDLALGGFAVSPRMAASIAGSADDLRNDPDAARYFFTPGGQPLPVGWQLYSPALAETLARVAARGSDGFYQGEIAEAIVAQVSQPPNGATPGLLALDDLASYRAKVREASCVPYRDWEVCGFPPPSSGGIAVGQMMGMLQHFDLAELAPRQAPSGAILPAPRAVHLLAEAGRLAFADRNHYVADTDFVPLPGEGGRGLLQLDYLARQAARIEDNRSLGRTEPGWPGAGAADNRPGLPDTTHVSIVDMYGNVLSMTTSVEGGFGSYMMVNGFLLNNQLTDFSPDSHDAQGRLIANRVQAGKRPRSSMAPTMVFERGRDGERGRPVVATGSPGGAAIIPYVANHLVALLDWGLSPSEAMAMPHFGAFNSPGTVLEAEHPLLPSGWPDDIVDYLQLRGHEVSYRPRTSGLATILMSPPVLVRPLTAAADPRREGVARGN